jgi:hypothetical protein
MWECTEGAACECFFLDHVEHEHFDKTFHHGNMAPDSKQTLTSQVSLLKLRKASPAQRWRALVSKYSQLNLIKEKDIFPALSGLAKQMNREIKDTYLAGLWKGNLPVNLLWQVTVPKKEKLSQWRAPSWSWVHWKSPVIWVDDLKKQCILELHLRILVTKQDLVGENEMGEISSAWILVSAQLCPATLAVFIPKPDAGASRG